MHKTIVCLTLFLLVAFGSADDTTNSTQTASATTAGLKETSDPAPGVNDEISEMQSKNKTDDISADEKMKGFLKLYNFAIKHGKLNLTETLKNLTNLNDTVPLTNVTKALTSTKEHNTEAKTNATVVKLPAKSGAKITNKPKKEEEVGSGDESDGKEKKKHNKDTYDETWDDDGDENGKDGNYHDDGNNYHDDYEGGNGHGYSYNNDNGDVNGHGYQYQYDNPSNAIGGSMGGGINGGVGGGMTSAVGGGMTGAVGGGMNGGLGGGMTDGMVGGMGGGMNNNMGLMGTGAFTQGDSFGSELSPHEGLGETLENDNPSEYNQQGFINYDDGTTQMASNGNYDKKKHIHKLKKNNKRHHEVKVHPKIVHLHTNAKHHHMGSREAKKLVTMKKHYIEGNGYRRTIMIGNRVCGAKKSTNVQTRDEIHMQQDEPDDNMVKRDTKHNRDTTHGDDASAIRATDQCCADHYECARIVPAKATKFGYTNDIEYDVMACNCDSKFRNCLKTANSYTADAVGHLYFNTLKIPCLTFEHDSPDPKSEQPEAPQESLNTVSIVPDVETDRETVGGAQLVVSPLGEHHKGEQRPKDVAPENEQLHQGSPQTERMQHEETVQVNTHKGLVKDTEQSHHSELQEFPKDTEQSHHSQPQEFLKDTEQSHHSQPQEFLKDTEQSHHSQSQEFLKEVQQEQRQQDLLKEANQHSHTQQFLKEAQKQAHGDTPTFHVFKEDTSKEEDNNDEQTQPQQILKKKHRPQSINPNPKPQIIQSVPNQRFTGIVTSQEAYTD